jgi:hypothetical protein
MKRRLHSPSPALVISIVALVLAASGTAVAASKLVSGNSLIKVNSLSGNRLKKGSVTGKQIALNSLGTVPSAKQAISATSATSATTATTANTATTAGSAPIANVTYVTSGGNVTSGVLTLTATCPSGTTVIGGGANLSDETEAYVNDSYPSGKAGWTADFEPNYTDITDPAVVTAICAPAAATTGS